MRTGSVFKPTKLFLASLLLAAVSALCFSSVQALEDPTRPPSAEIKTHYVATQKSQQPRWTLNSTLVSSGRRTAIINNKAVSLGDRINGATVVSIEPSTVRLREKGREVTLMMLQKNIKSLSRSESSGQAK
jgi:hypothetical protein